MRSRDAVARQRRDHEGRFKLCGLVGVVRQASSASLATRSILLRISTFGALTSPSRAQNILRLLVEPLARIDHDADEIGIVRAAPGGRHHGAVEPPLRRENARRIDEDQSATCPSIAMPRISARVVCTLCETMVTLEPTSALSSVDLPALGAPISATKPQCVWLCLRVRISHQACPPTRRRASSMAAAAACSAARLELPRPSAGGRSGSTTATRNSGSWCGPVRASSR